MADEVKITRAGWGSFMAALDKLRSLSPQQQQIVALIAGRRGGIISWSEIEEALWGDREDGGALSARRAIHVVVYQLRHLGLPIATHHRRGLSWQQGSGDTIEVRRCRCGGTITGHNRKHCSDACRRERDRARKAPARAYRKRAA